MPTAQPVHPLRYRLAVRGKEWVHVAVEDALRTVDWAEGGASNFFAAALPWAQAVHAQLPQLFVSLVLAQWAEEQGYRWPPMYDNPGNVGDPAAAGQLAFPSVGAGVGGYIQCMKLGYYVAVRAATSRDAQAYALGESPYAAGHYDGAGPPPGEDLVKIMASFDLAQYDVGAPAPPPPAPPPHPTPTEEAVMGDICTDPQPSVGGGSWALAPDGGVDTADGAPILGSLAGDRFGWQALGTLWGITPWKDSTGNWGYKIAVKLNEGTAPDGGDFDYYRFPRNGSLLLKAGQEDDARYEDSYAHKAATGQLDKDGNALP